MTDMFTVCLVTWFSFTCALHKYALQMSSRGWRCGLFACWRTEQHFGKWKFHFTNSEHIFQPAVSSVRISARNTAAVRKIRKSWAIWPTELTPRASQGDLLTCSPSRVLHCIYIFIPTLPKQICMVKIRMHSYIFEIAVWSNGRRCYTPRHFWGFTASGLGSCCPPLLLPAYKSAIYSLHPAAMAHRHLMLHFGGLEASAILFQSTTQSFPYRTGLNLVLFLFF